MTDAPDANGEEELANKLDAAEDVAYHNAGVLNRSLDVDFEAGTMAHGPVLDICRGHGYRVQYVDFDGNSICFMND